MKWFNNLKIKVKLISCFVIVALFIGIIGFLGVQNAGNINNNAMTMYSDYLAAISTMKDL